MAIYPIVAMILVLANKIPLRRVTTISATRFTSSIKPWRIIVSGGNDL